MTREDLIGYGYMPEICKIGELFFKDSFFCKLLDDGSVDFRYSSDDMKSVVIVHSLHELGVAELQYYKELEELYNNSAKIVHTIIENYIIPLDDTDLKK